MRPSYSANRETLPSLSPVGWGRTPRRGNTCHSPMKDWLPSAFTCHSDCIRITFFIPRYLLQIFCLRLLAPTTYLILGISSVSRQTTCFGVRLLMFLSVSGWKGIGVILHCSVYYRGDKIVLLTRRIHRHTILAFGIFPLSGISHKIPDLSISSIPDIYKVASDCSVQRDWRFFTQLTVCLIRWLIFSFQCLPFVWHVLHYIISNLIMQAYLIIFFCIL